MNIHFSEFKLEKLYTNNGQNNLNFLLENKEALFAQSQLVAAAKQIPDISWEHLLKLLLTEKVVKEIDWVAIPTCNPEKIEKLVAELHDAVQLSKAIQAGFDYDEKKSRYHFNANRFAQYFLSRIRIVNNVHNLLYVYSNEGFYKIVSNVEIGMLVRTLMNEAVPNSWKTRHEREAIEAIKRECFTLTEMDNIPNCINLKNGMYMIDTGILEPHHPNFLSTVQIPVYYDEQATCPNFIKFLNEITHGDAAYIVVLQQMIGYLLSSETKCETAFFLYGDGSNGKTVLSEIISALVGDENVSNIPLSQFDKDFGLEGIIGKKVNIAPENELKNSPFNTQSFKAIVSGDGMTINMKYLSPLTNYKSKCRLLFLLNHLPNTSDESNGYYRRISIFPFKRTFSETEQNRDLKEELKKELPGIFNWAMEGFKQLKEQQFTFSKAQVIEDELVKYRLSQQPVYSFFDSVIELDADSTIKRSELFEYYTMWCNEKNLSSNAKRTRQKFYDDITTLINRKFLPIEIKRIQGYEYYKGMKFKAF